MTTSRQLLDLTSLAREAARHLEALSAARLRVLAQEDTSAAATVDVLDARDAAGLALAHMAGLCPACDRYGWSVDTVLPAWPVKGVGPRGSAALVRMGAESYQDDATYAEALQRWAGELDELGAEAEGRAA